MANVSFQLKDVQRMRKLLGLTQIELAKLSGVSQSLIAKIEAGRVDPSFSKVMTLFQILQRLQLKNAKKVRKVMTRHVVSVDASVEIGRAVRLMHEHAISQMPVTKHGEVIGSVSEKSLIEKLSAGESSTELFTRRVSEVMEPPFPMVRDDAPVDVLVPLVNFYSAVLVMRGRSIAGIVTRADLLKPE